MLVASLQKLVVLPCLALDPSHDGRKSTKLKWSMRRRCSWFENKVCKKDGTPNNVKKETRLYSGTGYTFGSFILSSLAIPIATNIGHIQLDQFELSIVRRSVESCSRARLSVTCSRARCVGADGTAPACGLWHCILVISVFSPAGNTFPLSQIALVGNESSHDCHDWEGDPSCKGFTSNTGRW